MVYSRPSNAVGPMRGMNTPSYQAAPRRATRRRRVRYPATSGTPRKTTTLLAICPIETSIAAGAAPNHPGTTVRIEPPEHRVGQDLKDGVEGHEDGRELPGAAGQRIPQQHHGDAAGQPDEDQAVTVVGQVGEKQPGEPQHDQGPEDPVERQRSAQQPGVAGMPADGLVAHLREHRIHHPQESDRDRHRDTPHPHAVEGRPQSRVGPSQQDPQPHGREDPQRQIAVEGGQALEDRRGFGGGGHARRSSRIDRMGGVRPPGSPARVLRRPRCRRPSAGGPAFPASRSAGRAGGRSGG